MYKIKDDIINEVCDKLKAIAKLSLEAEELLRSGGANEVKSSIDYDPDEYILQHIQSRQSAKGEDAEERR